jgi:guanylate kinase
MIYYVMGKSASGKDTIYRQLRERNPQLTSIVLYTTRPMREGESEGTEYHFTTAQALDALEKDGKVIEIRTYQTVYGPWSYATVDDGSISPGEKGYIAIGTLESYEKMRRYFGDDNIVPIYIEVEDGLRLERALARERQQKHPRYEELCRRFLADQKDFSEERLRECGITGRYVNGDLERCIAQIMATIRSGASGRKISGADGHDADEQAARPADPEV